MRKKHQTRGPERPTETSTGPRPPGGVAHGPETARLPSEPLPPSVTDGSWQLRTRQNRVENRIRPAPSDLRRHPDHRPPHRVLLLLALATPSGSFGRPLSAPAGGRDGGVRPAAPDGPHAVREDVLRAAHHARRELAPRRHLPRRAWPTPVQGRECPSLSVAAPCYLTASGFLARIYLNPASRVVISLPAPLARVTLCALLDLALGRGRIGELVFDLRCHSIPVWRAFHV